MRKDAPILIRDKILTVNWNDNEDSSPSAGGGGAVSRARWTPQRAFWKFAYAAWLMALARRVDPVFQDRMRRFAQSFNVKFRDCRIRSAEHCAAPPKAIERVMTRQEEFTDFTVKLFPQYGDRLAAGGVCDLVRCSISFDSAEKLAEAYRKFMKYTMEKDGIEVVMYMNGYHPKAVHDNYRSVKVLCMMEVPGMPKDIRHIGEVQLILRTVVETKKHLHLLRGVLNGD